ncbi:hypothetical protein J1N35_010763 [Gossypium stocksii]|uniref:Uncharacterized protein n=1 Tax=Gossypium stocksii TaxID=47602 RepID=A0A9D4ACT1_9ROSI|nr:hypothetical protein J1N35_010763 [Gossypium stocksii]
MCKKSGKRKLPHLILEMCKRVGVPMEQMDKEMNPPKKLLGYDIYKQFQGEDE